MRMRVAVGVASVLLTAQAAGGASAQGDDRDWSLTYDKATKRFEAVPSEGSICDRLGDGLVLTDEGDACWYPQTMLGFLSDLGFDGDADGFSAVDGEGDVLMFMESRLAEQQRFDVRGLQWAEIDATAALLEAAAGAPGAVVGDAYDTSPGPRAAFFVDLSEPPVRDGDTLALNTNTYTDDDVTNDMVRSLDASFPNGGGDTNISAGWSFIDDETVRTPAIAVWSEAELNLVPGNIVAGPSEDPPGVWAITGREHLGESFNVVVLTKPLGTPLLIDRVEGANGPFGSFMLDGRIQAYIEGFTMAGTANVPGADFLLTFHTPYAPLFEGGTARIGFLTGTDEQSFEKDYQTSEGTIELGLSLPTGATGLTAIEFMPSKKAKVDVDGREKPVALKQWLKGDQPAEFSAAVRQIMGLSMASRFELAEGQEVSLGAAPNP
jgi:hypothetical protein